MSYLCQIPVKYLSNTCQIPVKYLSNTCQIPVKYLSNTCQIPVKYLSNTCQIPVKYLSNACQMPVKYLSNTSIQNFITYVIAKGTWNTSIQNFIIYAITRGTWYTSIHNFIIYAIAKGTWNTREGVNHQEVSEILKQIRIKNLKNVIIGHLNVNSFAPKLDALKTIISNNMDIMVFCETKLDDSYPTTQLIINGYKKPYRMDRDSNGGGILVYVRSDIPSTLKICHAFSEEIEGLFIEINGCYLVHIIHPLEMIISILFL